MSAPAFVPAFGNAFLRRWHRTALTSSTPIVAWTSHRSSRPYPPMPDAAGDEQSPSVVVVDGALDLIVGLPPEPCPIEPGHHLHMLEIPPGVKYMVEGGDNSRITVYGLCLRRASSEGNVSYWKVIRAS